MRERLRPHGRVGGALGARRAAPHAGSRALAAGQAADVLGADRVRGRPPVPVELVHPLGRAPSDRTDRERRQERRRPCRVVGVPGHARDLHLLVDPLVVRLHLLVGDGPVVRDAVQGPELVVLGPQPHPLGAEVNRAAADRVVHHRRDGRARDLEGIVGRVLPRVRVRAPLRVRDELPLELVAGEVGSVLPAALLQADDLEARLGQVARRHRAARAGADDEDVGLRAVARERERERRRRLDRLGRRRGGRVDRPASVDGVEKPVAQVVLGLVGEGRPLALARIADPLPDLEVHVVAARGDLRERGEPVRVLGVQAPRLALGVASGGRVEHGGERLHQVRPGLEGPVEPLLDRAGVAGRRHGVRGRDENVGQGPERRPLLGCEAHDQLNAGMTSSAMRRSWPLTSGTSTSLCAKSLRM